MFNTMWVRMISCSSTFLGIFSQSLSTPLKLQEISWWVFLTFISLLLQWMLQLIRRLGQFIVYLCRNISQSLYIWIRSVIGWANALGTQGFNDRGIALPSVVKHLKYICMYMCSNKIYVTTTDSVLYIAIWENKKNVDWEHIALFWPSTYQELGRHWSLGGAQRLNRVVLYGKDQIPMEKLQNLGEPWPPWFLRLCICSRYINGKAHDA